MDVIRSIMRICAWNKYIQYNYRYIQIVNMLTYIRAVCVLSRSSVGFVLHANYKRGWLWVGEK